MQTCREATERADRRAVNVLDAVGMADVAPLRAIHFEFETFGQKLGRVVAPPYDVIGPEFAARLREADPHNVVRLILPEGEGDAKYAHAREQFEAWQADKTLIADETPCFYVLEQTFVPPGGLSSARVRRRGSSRPPAPSHDRIPCRARRRACSPGPW